MRKKILISCLNLLLLLVVGSTVVFAWYTNGINTTKIVITSANLATQITLHKGYDFNYDGNLDLDSSGNEMYEEVYKIDKGGEKILIFSFGDIKLSLDPNPNAEPPKEHYYPSDGMCYIIPTEIHTWKIDVKNLGDADGYFHLNLHQDISDEQMDYISCLSARYFRVGSDEPISNKVYLGELEPGKTIVGGMKDDLVKIGNNPESFVIKFEFELYENLPEVVRGKFTKEEYQALQGKQTTVFNFVNVVLASEATNQPSDS